MALIQNGTRNGTPIAVFRVEGEYEENAYRALLKQDMPTCPHCGQPLVPRAGKMLVEVANPLAGSVLGMELGTFTTVCSRCEAKVDLPVQVDIACFKSIVQILKASRAKYKDQLAVARRRGVAVSVS